MFFYHVTAFFVSLRHTVQPKPGVRGSEKQNSHAEFQYFCQRERTNPGAALSMPSIRLAYYRRIMTAMVVILVIFIALVRWWPPSDGLTGDRPFDDRPTERIQVRDIQPTSQSKEKVPAPPAPLPPVVVPNDVLIKDPLEFGDAELQVEEPEEDDELQQGTARATATRQPDTGARLLKNVQPNYPPAAQEEEIRARIAIEVQITETGAVADATIEGRWRLSANGSSHPVTELGYGLEESALAAAHRSLFRPAQAQGRPVATRKVITFTFGTP